MLFSLQRRGTRRKLPWQATSAGLALILVGTLGVTTAQANGPGPAPRDPVAIPRYAPAPAARSWEGSYYGFTLGYNFRGTDRVQLAPAPPGVIGTLRVRGAVLGGQLGHNWQRGDMVYGIEGGLNLLATRDALTSGTASASMRIRPVADLRGRVGMAAGEGLLYATAGLSAARVNYTASDGVTSNINSRYTALGYSVGVGYERMIQGNWSMRGEYSYTQYRGRNLTDGVHTTRATPDYHSLRFGLNRRF
ncbi:MAG: outer membrane protein [Pararhodobacter sp.]